MGQKVHPESMRVGYIHDWKAHWFTERHFADYLAFAFATATAFSPTDVAAIKRWAKMLMILQAVASLVLATLVLAKAINGIGTPIPPQCVKVTSSSS